MIKLFADGADKAQMIEMYNHPDIAGLTTNPSLMCQAGITDYKAFALDILKDIKEKPISFEVFSDDFAEMKRQALEIASWGPNVYVKIPITNTKGESSNMLIKDLNWSGIKINVTAITTMSQVYSTFKGLPYKRGVYISIFAGRIADCGQNPMSTIMEAVELVFGTNVEIIWASPREVYNVVQAEKCGCHIITLSNDLIKKLPLFGKDLTEYSRETVQLFYDDSIKAGFKL
jgi:transaldolase